MASHFTSVPMTKVELSVSAKKLRNKDIGSKSDPACLLLLLDPNENKFSEIGRTEVIENEQNPSWIYKFQVDFRFEEKQILKFSIYDWDTKSSKETDQDALGSVTVALAEIMSRPGGHYEKELPKGGTLYVSGHEASASKEVVTLEFSAKDLDKKDFFGKSDPFLVISRASGDGFTPVHKTPYLKSTLDPHWSTFTIPNSTLCHGDYDCQLRIECFDWDSNGEHDLIGEHFPTLRSLINPLETTHSLINRKKQAKKSSYKDSGKLTICRCSVHLEPSFLDTIQGGTQLHFTVAVDFTASNGDPKNPRSLHYHQAATDNQYTTAIKSVGEIIQEYDSDKMFPALGFGGKIPPEGKVSHEFFLNGSSDNPYCQGLQGILAAYQHSIQTVQLYGPTNFSPVIRHVMRFASTNQQHNYFVLLIITDGIISDLAETRKALVEASVLPMSVIIVAVGEEDFSAMDLLDGDNQRLSYDGIVAERDIVQFVELQTYLSQSLTPEMVKSRLAKDVLAEIPAQLLSWTKLKNA